MLGKENEQMLDDATVIIPFATGSGFAKCPLKFKCGKAYAITHEYFKKGTDEKIGGDEAIELDMALLTPTDPAIHRANYIYNKPLDLRDE